MKPATSGGDEPSRLVYVLFFILLLQLPAESARPLVSINGLIITNLEAALGLLLVAFGLWKLRQLRRTGTRYKCAENSPFPQRDGWRARLTEPGFWLVLWLLLALLSALLSPEHRGHALKFVFRCAAIASVYWISRSLHTGSPRGDRRLRTTLGTLVVLGAAITLLGSLEGLGEGPAEPFLTIFRNVPTNVDGTHRLTATFSHANQAAAFLALVLPLAAALCLIAKDWTRWIWGLAGALILWGLLGTLSRSAIVASLLCVLILVAFHSRERTTRRSALLMVLGLVVLCGTRWVTDPPFRARFGLRPTDVRVAASYVAPDGVTLGPGQVTRVEVKVRNLGTTTWGSGGSDPVKLSYHIIRMSDEKVVLFDGPRTPLPRPVPPGGLANLAAWLRAPETTGRFVVSWDLVREGVAWFSSRDVPTALTRLSVVPGDSVLVAQKDRWEDIPAARLRAAASRADTMVEWTPVGRLTLWRVAGKLFARRPWIGWGPDTFRLLYSRGLGPGRWDPRLHANNLYLELLVTTGLLGLAAWIGFMVALAIRGGNAVVWEVRQGRGGPSRSYVLLAGVGAAFLTFAVHGILDSFLEFYGIMGLFWTLAGALAGKRTTDCYTQALPVD